MTNPSFKLGRAWLALVFTVFVAACGGGGGGSTPALSQRTLVSIALTPASVSLPDSGTQQLTVTGTYSDGTSAPITSGATYSSSNTAVATVSTTGLVTVASGAALGTTATISATASSISTTSATSTLVTVANVPTGTSIDAATNTATNNALCTRVSPFYWEIGDKTGALASASVGVDANNAPIVATTVLPWASASKWIYGMYVAQVRGAAGLTAQDINFLHFTSGYTNMGSDTTSFTCTAPAGGGANSINNCLTESGPGGPFNGQEAASTGVFDYDSGHEENHAGQFQPEINALDVSNLGAGIIAGLGLTGSVSFNYNQPLLAGGIQGTADDYTTILRAMLGGNLLMNGLLGASPVCAWTGAADCTAFSSPIKTEHWHYSIGHWIEDDPTQNNDGAFSSPGAFGFYPWIEKGKVYYGVIARAEASNGVIQNGLASAQCGALIRHAWDTGVEQTEALPAN